MTEGTQGIADSMETEQATHRPLPRPGRSRAFTLIELLIVVSILAILAAIAVPNFLEAQVRAKITAAKANLRTTGSALEAYRVDNSDYPHAVPVVPEDPLALLCSQQLRALTTPIAYMTSTSSMRDPFGTARLYSLLQAPGPPGGVGETDVLFPPNEHRSLLYYHYASTSHRLAAPWIDAPGHALISIGPDRKDSLGAYSHIDGDQFRSAFRYSFIREPISTIYDPTNGTVSVGDIIWRSPSPGGLVN